MVLKKIKNDSNKKIKKNTTKKIKTKNILSINNEFADKKIKKSNKLIEDDKVKKVKKTVSKKVKKSNKLIEDDNVKKVKKTVSKKVKKSNELIEDDNVKKVKKSNKFNKFKKNNELIEVNNFNKVNKNYNIKSELTSIINNDNKNLKSIKLLKYLLKLGFPYRKYFAYTSYYNTKIINNKPVSNFTKIYKKKFLFDHYVNKYSVSESINLFNKSYKYISKLQNNLLEYDIESYISGGAAIKLYSNILDIKNNNNDLVTNDYDIYLYYNEDKLTDSILYKKINNIIDSILKITLYPKYSYLELYILLEYNDVNSIIELFKTFIDDGYDLYNYLLINKNKYKNYIFKFIKLIDTEFCVRIKFNFTTNFDLQENIDGYIKTNFYNINRTKNGKFIVSDTYMPIEFLLKNKNKSNFKLIKSSIKYDNDVFYICNENTLLYNLMNLYYKYNNETGNYIITQKKKRGKNIRDEKRLDIFFKIYCNLIYPKLLNNKINELLKKIKDSSKNFKEGIEDIKNFKMIDDIFSN